MQQSRKVDLKDVFCYPLGHVLWALATSNGEVMKTSKSKLMHEPEKGVTTTVSVPIPFVSISNGMVLFRMFKCIGLIYNKFVDDILKFAVARRSGSKRIDIVFDVYYENSIKATGKLQFKAIFGSSQIKQWGAFLSNGNNKAELIRFLVSRWERQSFIIGDANLYVVVDVQYICIKTDGSSELIENLECNQEADTRMLLHAQHICH